MEPITVITATVNLIDLLNKWFGNNSNESSGISASQEGLNTLVIKQQGKSIRRIKGSELEKLDPDDYKLVKAYESSMKASFDLWRIIYPQKSQTNDPITNAKTEQQLNQITTRMCYDFGEISMYLNSIGIELEDYYPNIRHLCKQNLSDNAL